MVSDRPLCRRLERRGEAFGGQGMGPRFPAAAWAVRASGGIATEVESGGLQWTWPGPGPDGWLGYNSEVKVDAK
jgi:hypothetical protein